MGTMTVEEAKAIMSSAIADGSVQAINLPEQRPEVREALRKIAKLKAKAQKEKKKARVAGIVTLSKVGPVFCPSCHQHAYDYRRGQEEGHFLITDRQGRTVISLSDSVNMVRNRFPCVCGKDIDMMREGKQ